MRIEVVHPEQQRRGGAGLEVRDRAIGGLAGRAFAASRAQLVVVHIEAATPARTAATARRRRRTPRCDSRRAELLGQHRKRLREIAAVLVDTVSARDTARSSSNCAMGAFQGPWRRPDVAAAARGERVEGRRLDAAGVGPDRVGPRRIERHEQDRRPDARVSGPARRAGPAAAADGGNHHGGHDDEGPAASPHPASISDLSGRAGLCRPYPYLTCTCRSRSIARRMRPTIGLLLTIGALLVPAAARGQETSAIAGQIVDLSGAPVAGATIRLTGNLLRPRARPPRTTTGAIAWRSSRPAPTSSTSRRPASDGSQARSSRSPNTTRSATSCSARSAKRSPSRRRRLTSISNPLRSASRTSATSSRSCRSTAATWD